MALIGNLMIYPTNSDHVALETDVPNLFNLALGAKSNAQRATPSTLQKINARVYGMRFQDLAPCRTRYGLEVCV